MKKKDVISLIKYFSENNREAFKNEAYSIAKDFDAAGDYQLAEYIMALLSEGNTLVPQNSDIDLTFFEKLDTKGDLLLLPDKIMQDILGVVNAVERKMGLNKFLFKGAPGTGKTEAAKQLARILDREIYMVNFSMVIDSKLGQTQKNIAKLFHEVNSFVYPERIVVLFDEIDAIALDRTNSNDLREMGRATSEMLKGFDRINDDILLIATTNLYDYFDKALIRRFDSVIDFNRYSQEDLLEISERIMDLYLNQLNLRNRDVRLFRKIIKLYNVIPYPSDLKNVIRTAIAFSDPNDGTDYFRRLYYSICGEKPEDITKLKEEGFTVREIEILTKKSKSSVARELKKVKSSE